MDAMDGIAGAEARIAQIQSQFTFGADGAGGRLGASASTDATTTASSSDAPSFADTLNQAQAATAPVPASTGALNRAGVDPVQWAKDFLTKINMPITPENVRAIKAWEQAEGTAARFNPLATTQGGFAGATSFNSVGVKNYVSYADGLAANAKVIQNGLYGNILAALRAGNSAAGVADAIKNSPWGTGGLVAKIIASGG
jgi:hypothetical protein